MALTGPSLVIEQQIIHGLLTDDVFLRMAIPHLKDDYFTDEGARIVFKASREHITEFNSPPSREALLIAVDAMPGIRQQATDHALAVVESVTSSAFVPSNREWLVKTAERYVQDRAVYNALLESISILDDKKSKKTKGSIPQLLTDALAVSFDTNVGHDYVNAAEDRFRYYHRIEERIPFDIDILNEITKGGLPKKTLTIIQAGCVTVDAVVDLLVDGKEFNGVPFATIEHALASGMEVRIASPAGWSLVEAYHHKGFYVGYDVYCVSSDEFVVTVNEDHLFAIAGAWVRAADLTRFQSVPLMSVNGTSDCVVIQSDRRVLIVDITVGADSIPYTAASES